MTEQELLEKMQYTTQELLEKMQYTTSCIDNESKETDYSFEKASAGIEIDLPWYVIHSNRTILNQWPTMHCVAYWTTEWVNEENYMLSVDKSYNPISLVNYIRQNLDRTIDQDWTLIENWPKWARKLWWIEVYTYCNTLYDLKRAIAFVWPIATGTNKINWLELKKDWYVAKLWSGWWHFINIVWYDDKKEWFIVENTWWKEWWDNGYYYIPYDIALDVLFNTKISMIVDSEKNTEYTKKLLNNLSNKKMEEIRNNIDLEKAKRAYDNKFWNWLNPREPMSRQEVMAVIQNVIDKYLIK